MSHNSNVISIEFKNVASIYLDSNKHTVVIFKSGLVVTLHDPTNADLLSEYQTWRRMRAHLLCRESLLSIVPIILLSLILALFLVSARSTNNTKAS